MTHSNNEDIRILTIRNKLGLHARASAKFVTIAGQYDATLKVSKDGTSVTGTSIMGLLMLSASTGDQISIEGDGPQKDELMNAIENLVNNKFDEKE